MQMYWITGKTLSLHVRTDSQNSDPIYHLASVFDTICRREPRPWFESHFEAIWQIFREIHGQTSFVA